MGTAMNLSSDKLLDHARELGDEADLVLLEAEELLQEVEETIAHSEARMQRIRGAVAREARASAYVTEDIFTR